MGGDAVTCLRPDRMDLYLEGELDEAERREDRKSVV